MAADLLLLHGALGSREQVRPLAEALRQGPAVRDRIHELDFSGHGLNAGLGGTAGTNPNDRGEFTIERFATDLVAFLDREGIAKADIFGYSMGGYVALQVARLTPDRIGMIMTLGTKFAWDPPTAKKEASRLDPAVLEEKVPAFAAQLRRRHGEAWADVVRSTARMMLGLGDHPTLGEQDYRAIAHRTLVSIGDRDTMVSVEETLGVSRNLYAGACLVLPGLPHPLEQADTGLLAYHLRRFLDSP